MTTPINVVKIGGNVIDDPTNLAAFLADFAAMPGPKILIHGGGKEATRLSARLEIPTNMVGGRRVTDAATLEVVTMVYAGLINKRIVAALGNLGCPALGLSGADGSAILATRRSPNPIDFGFVGDIEPKCVNTHLISNLLAAGLTPVFCAIAGDRDSSGLLNCNADSVASAVAKAMATVADVNLTFCFELPGVLTDINDPDSLISNLARTDFDDLAAKGIVAKGMLPKLTGAFDALDAGVKNVRIAHFSNFASPNGGTTLLKDCHPN